MAKLGDHDYDDLLSQATAPRENTRADQGATVERSIARDRLEEGQAKFKIDQKDSNLSGKLAFFRNGSRLELDPQSFRNEVEIYEANRHRKRLFILLFSMIVACIFAGGIVASLPQNTPINSVAPAANNLRFLKLYADAPQPHINEMAITASGSTVTTLIGSNKTGASLAFQNLKFSDIAGCRVTHIGEFDRCLTTNPESPSLSTQIWLTKDGVRSPLFSDAKNFNPINVAGASAAATMILSGIAQEPRATLVIVAQDVAGYIIVLPAKATLADAKALAETITVK